MRTILIISAVGLFAACSAAPKPLPGGPPPEYEPPRGYDAGAGIDTNSTAAPPAPPPGPPPTEPTPAPPP